MTRSGITEEGGWRIRRATPADRDCLMDIWSRSVRATHTFLTPADIAGLTPLVRDYLASSEPEFWVLESGARHAIGFMGMSGSKIDALFLAPEQHRKGGGRRLVHHARQLKGELSVDVNEQNPAACRFYRAMGFVVEGRSELDDTGRPFPLLHMRLAGPTPRSGDWTDASGRKTFPMPEKAIYLLVVDGFSDWEPAHALAELRRGGGFRVETVGLTADPVESMGGLRVLPTTTVGAVDPADVAAFIIPGADRWEKGPVEPELQRLLGALDAAGVPLAVICGATIVPARLGLLRGRRHTSNGLAYLRSQVADYREAANYVDAPAVRDRGLITASGLSDVEFAREIMEELGVLSPEDRAAWAALFRAGRLPAGPD